MSAGDLRLLEYLDGALMQISNVRVSDLGERRPGVVYQVYPRSFKDTTGNGIGDIPGIVVKLDYLKELGVDTIWFSPFFRSPQIDQGYDISDFCNIAPEHGKMADFDLLLNEMHARNMKMILDFVLSHTSIEHPWFLESASSKDNPKRNWYIWRNGKKPDGRKPPNNWRAMTGGPAWQYFRNTDQWAYFHFLPCEVDLNYREPEVKKTMMGIMRFWLDKGVDGFRLDLLHAIYEDERLRDNPLSWRLLPSDKSTSLLFRSHKYDLNLPETYSFAVELRKIVDEYEPKRFLIGEVFGTMEELRHYYGPHSTGLHMIFLFEFTSTAFRPHRYTKLIRRIEEVLPEPHTPTYVFGNHDRMRFITRLGNDTRKAKIAATMQFTLRGIPFIYYGEEIGMPNSKINLKTSKDPIGRKYAWLPFSQIKGLGFSISRDGCRTPMQWDDGPNASFSFNPSTQPWLDISPSYWNLNVKNEKADPNSLWNCYRRLIHLRRENSALQRGAFKFISVGKLGKKCLAYRRIYQNQEIFVYLNFSKKSLRLSCPVGETDVLFSTRPTRKDIPVEADGSMTLAPLEGIIFRHS